MNVDDCPAVRTAVPVDDAPAGPAMDAAVARALGWVKVECDGCYYWSDPQIDEWHNDRLASSRNMAGYELEGAIVWSPSTDVAAAWGLVEVMQSELSNPWAIFCKELNNGVKLLRGKAKGDAPLAICRVFLKARGVGEIDV